MAKEGKDEDLRPSFSPLERCFWTLCECRVHKPADSGWVVAYYSAKYQAKCVRSHVELLQILMQACYVEIGRPEITRVYV